MKKTIIYLAAALAFVSCSQNEITEDALVPVNSEVIGFTASTNGTRANANTTEEMKSGFSVIGLDQAGTPLFTKPAGSTSNNSYKWLDTGKWGWNTEQADKKWPAQSAYPLTFIVPFPTLVDADYDAFGPWVSGGAVYTKDIQIDNADIKTNEDLLAAYSVVTTKPVSGMASLSFKHILSKIQFQVVSPVGYKICIQSLIIKNVAKAGRSYDYKKLVTEAYSAEPVDGYTSIESYVHMEKPDDVYEGAVEFIGAGFSDPTTQGIPILSGWPGTGTETWKLMPQKTVPTWDKVAFSAAAKAYYANTEGKTWDEFVAATPALFAGSYIELVYRMEDPAGNSIIGRKPFEEFDGGSDPVAMYVKVAFPLNIASVNGGLGWEPNKQYTYQIKLGTPDASNGTLIDPNYKNDGDDDYDYPVENPKPVKPGEDITDKDGYIGFDVIVDEWADGGNTDIK